MSAERHYKIGKSLILDGTIKSFRDIFLYVPKTTVAKDLKMHFNTLQSRLDEPDTFTVGELTRIADLLGVDHLLIITMCYTQFAQERKPKKKK